MLKNTWKICGHCLLPAGGLILIVLLVFFGWIALEPRSVSYLTEQLEESFNEISPDYTIKIGDTMLRWDGWQEALGLHIINLSIIDNHQNKVAQFSDVKVGLRFSQLFLGRIAFRDLSILNPEFRIAIAQKQKPLSDELAEQEKAAITFPQILGAIKRAFDNNPGKIPLSSVQLLNGMVVLDDGYKEVPLAIPKANIVFTLEGGVPKFTSHIESKYAETPMVLKIDSVMEYGDIFPITVEAQDISPQFIADIRQDYGWLQLLQSNFNGDARLALNTEGVIEDSEFHISLMKKPMTFEVWGQYINHHYYKERKNTPEITIDALLTNFPMDDLHLYWPPNISVDARKWVTQNISGGVVKRGTAKVVVMPENVVSGFITETAVDADLEFRGLEVNFSDRLPNLNNASGIAKFDGQNMDLEVTSGAIKESSVTGFIRLYNLGRDTERAEIEGVLEGPAYDLIDFFELKRVKDDRADSSYSLSDIKGKASTGFLFRFPLLEDLLIEDIDFEAGAQLSEISLPNIWRGNALEGGNFSLMANSKDAEIDGTGYVKGVLMNIDVKEDFQEKTLYRSKINVNTTVTAREIVALGGPTLDFITGPLDVSIALKNAQNFQDVKVGVGAQSAAIDLPAYGYNKPKKVNTSLTASWKDEVHTTRNDVVFEVKGDGIKLRGAGLFNEKTLGDFELHIPRLVHGKHNFALDYVREDKVDVVTIKGKQFDFGPFAIHASELFSDKGEARGLELHIDVNAMPMAGGEQLNNVTGFVKCGVKHCMDADFLGTFAQEGEVRIRLGKDKDQPKQRVFKLVSNNAGALLNGLDVLEDVRGGEVETTAIIDHSRKDPPAEGSIIMKDFKVVKMPILTRLLTLGSLTGIVDLLNGQGISFKKLQGSYALEDGALKIDKMRAAGDSIGLTTAGEINLKDSRLKLKGELVPAYTLNTILGNVPLIGTVLSSGGEGAVVATRYSIEGKTDKPEISVNPLSMLTPGFLRNIWGDITPDKREEEKE